MTTSEIIRVILIVGLIIAYLVYRSRSQGNSQKRNARKELEETRKREAEQAEQRVAARKKQQAEQQAQIRRTSQILKLNLEGLEQKSTEIAGSTLWYLEAGAGKGPVVVLLHGFASQKEDWIEFAGPLLQQGCHVVAPDLPGFGQNEKQPDINYEVTTQAKRIRAFTKDLGLEQFHLVGSSLGGSIAAAYTFGAADQISSLTLIEPFCVRVPYQSKLDEYLARDINPLAIGSPEAYDHLLNFLFVQPPNFPESVKNVRARNLAENRDFYLKMWPQIRGGDRAHLLDLLLPEINKNVLVIQGEKSNVVHPSTPQMITNSLRSAMAVTVPDCGHLPAVERPLETAGHFMQFLARVRASPTGPQAGDPA